MKPPVRPRPSRRALLAAGLAASEATGLRIGGEVRGGSGQVQSASVDLRGWYRLTLSTTEEPSALVETVDVDVTGVDGGGIVFAEYLYGLALSTGDVLEIDGGPLAVVEVP
jgi:hypothetical protein